VAPSEAQAGAQDFAFAILEAAVWSQEIALKYTCVHHGPLDFGTVGKTGKISALFFHVFQR
jgi:hypothetical protein